MPKIHTKARVRFRLPSDRRSTGRDRVAGRRRRRGGCERRISRWRSCPTAAIALTRLRRWCGRLRCRAGACATRREGSRRRRGRVRARFGGRHPTSAARRSGCRRGGPRRCDDLQDPQQPRPDPLPGRDRRDDPAGGGPADHRDHGQPLDPQEQRDEGMAEGSPRTGSSCSRPTTRHGSTRWCG